MRKHFHVRLKSPGTHSTVMWCLFMAMLLIHFDGFSQTIVEGKVTSSENAEGLPGVTVLVKATGNGTVTDGEGRYKLTVASPNAELTFSFISFKTKTVSLNGRSRVDVSLDTDAQALDEVVVIGYGQQLKREATGAISQIKSEEINKLGTSDFATAIQGQLAGVSVRNSSGSPGSNAIINIRGISSFSAGGSEPLYVVDGVTYASNPNIAPQEIESIEVLKDGASAAIYGTRASAGVILITTKTGKAGRMQVSLDSYYGVQKITSDIHLANTAESLYITDLEQRFNTTGRFFPLESNPDALFYDTDWMNELQVDNAPTQSHSLSISGGKEQLKFNVVGTVFSQDGSLINSSYEKQSVRTNTVYEQDKFKAQATLGVSHSVKNNEPWALMYDAIRQAPYRKGPNTRDDVITIGGTNPEVLGGFVGKLKQESDNEENSFNGNLRLSYKLLDGLDLAANVGGSIWNATARYFEPGYTILDQEGVLNKVASNLNPRLQYTDQYNMRTIQEYTANYSKTFGDHKIALLAGNTYETQDYNSRRVRVQGLSSNETPTLSNGLDPQAAEDLSEWSSVSLLGRFQYSYKSKYLLSAVVRRDGSSRFGPENRWATFPSLSLGWNVSEEPFFEPLRTVVNEFKVRYGYGRTGSDRIPNYAYAAQVMSAADYILGGQLVSGLIQPGFADPSIKWETNISNNVGVDLQFLGGRGDLTVDLYKQDKQDMLLPVRTPPSGGAWGNFEDFIQNVGNMENKGIEIAAGFRDNIGDIGFRVNGTFTKNVNKVTQMVNGQVVYGGWPIITRQDQTEPAAVFKEGLPAGSLFLIPTSGVVKTQEELTEYQKIVPSAQLGDLRYVDTNGDNAITNDDREFAGSGLPDFEYGLNLGMDYKKFDLSVQFYGVEGTEIYNGPKAYAYSVKRHKDMVYGWSPNNPDSDIPSPRTNSEHPNVRTYSDYFREDGSFLRLRNVILGYTLPGTLTKRVHIAKVRLYVSAQNPVTWTNYTGFDPEVASSNPLLNSIDTGKYPVSATYRTGVTIDF
ncbi:TonB-dependent receptor [Pontibacter sp. E15-1]|uniref:SusC/RagA family TonB-linked outer membrane protein n=1 Tax=Pontibacter sp. E15-1 TaxID=2919918 RepID=UPI001F4F2BB6|nr:TonB-dependent receptor [Pontibacter sp. E15-1]MCJ8163284.1 TonB-dependent receptor [Pontibacter sp. E15-1]